MWYKVENGENIRPSDIDVTSSRVYVYIRKNIKLIEQKDNIPTHYEWEETKIPQEVWMFCEKTLNHDNAINDIYDALIELAELIPEE